MRKLISLAFIVALAGCQGSLLSYKSGIVLESQRIPLPTGNQISSSWESRDLRIDYQWTRTGDNLKISGKVQFAGQLKYNYTRLDYFNLALIFVGQNGDVFEIRNLAAKTDDGIESASFDTDAHLPPDTSYFAFSYQGVARNSESEDVDFWNYPFQKQK
jgi:hypothetical protein